MRILRIPAAFFLLTAFVVGCTDQIPTALSDSPAAAVASSDAATAPLFRHVSGAATGRARLHPSNQAGVKGVIHFTDNGGTLTVNGAVTGLVPGVDYMSLIYDNKSVPGGPEGCEPGIFDDSDPDFIIPTMFLGFLVNNGDGTGTLAAVNTNGGADYVPLSKIRAVSVRDLRIPGPFGPGTGPAAVVACGEVATHPAG